MYIKFLSETLQICNKWNLSHHPQDMQDTRYKILWRYFAMSVLEVDWLKCHTFIHTFGSDHDFRNKQFGTTWKPT